MGRPNGTDSDPPKIFVYKDSSGGQIPPYKTYLALAYLPVTPYELSSKLLRGGLYSGLYKGLL